jgi:hypothetical protein
MLNVLDSVVCGFRKIIQTNFFESKWLKRRSTNPPRCILYNKMNSVFSDDTLDDYDDNVEGSAIPTETVDHDEL